MRPYVLTPAVAMFLLQLAACGDPEVIRLGFVGRLEGRASEISIASFNAVRMAVDARNEAGGINGRQIRVFVRDDHGTAEGGAEAARSLISEGVEAIIGPNLSVVAGGMVPVINEAEIVAISPTVASQYFVGQDDYFYRINSSTREVAKSYAKHCIDAGHQKVAIGFDGKNQLYSMNLIHAFDEAFTALGGTLIEFREFNSTIRGDIPRLAIELSDSNPDALILLANAVDTALLAQQIRKHDTEVALLASQWATSDSLLTLGGGAIDGITLLQAYDGFDKSERYIAFGDSYSARFQSSPRFASIAAYDGVTVLFSVIENLAEDESIKSSIDAIGRFQGLQQIVEFDDFGDSTRKITTITVQEGKFIPK
ncbi:ABC transporter substrate-binding protein [Nisaea sp.]|uniref:ABC transporter substrate-binding protein n=1 Tax=Nisaea sp. TaxID=2024842 RepID=UPI003296C8B1